LHTDKLKAINKKQEELYQRVKNGDDSEVCYLKKEEEGKGVFDGNEINRIRLAYYILFEQIDCEEIIKRLFEYELEDRRTNSFQGIGISLEILTFLLMKYNQDGKYEYLFEQAKTANFDCACGYHQNIKIPSDIEKYTIEDCIYAALEMWYLDEAKELVCLWKENITDWNKETYQSLIFFHKYTENEIENEEPLKALLNIAKEKHNNTDLIAAFQHLLDYYVCFQNYQQAYETFTEMKRETDFTEIYHIRLFDSILEDCLEIICGYREKAEELWSWVKPFLKKKKVSSWFGNLYEKSIRAAEAVQDDSYAKTLTKNYQIWKKKMEW